MNPRQLTNIGVPDACVPAAIKDITLAAQNGTLKTIDVKKVLRELVQNPVAFKDHAIFSGLVADMLDYDAPATPRKAVPFDVWGASGIDENTITQMKEACSIPHAVQGALMPDAHVGYGLPIGGVLACDNAVVPYAIGVDIACRMKMSVLDVDPQLLFQSNREHLFDNALERGTRFGVGQEYAKPLQHSVMDQDWNITPVTRNNKDKAWRQLGTSGSGNHFAEFGTLTLDADDSGLGLKAGQYVTLLTHSGSRGAGSAVCSVYSDIARRKLTRRDVDVGRLAWLSLDMAEGQEYWAAMNLMGDYAAANHDCIHKLVAELLGAHIIAGVENHHNFAWKEVHNGKELIVHRKGATPAASGQLGVIPGSMASPAFVVRGKGNAASLQSASHGAGRAMSRTAARAKYTWKAVQNDLAKKGIRVLSAGADEVPGVYKDIHDVMREQQDLVDVVARFDPKVVKMCGDDSRAED